MAFAPDYSDVRGFQYQPSYAPTLMETWSQFDAETIATELDRGREYFPRMNAIRMRLSWNAFKLDPEAFEQNFETLLSLAADRDMRVMPELFNRWHNPTLDYGGEYIDHFWPDFDEEGVNAYLEAVVGEHADDDRVFMWDVCNEPFSGEYHEDDDSEILAAELDWLEYVSEMCTEELGVTAPVCVGVFSPRQLDLVEPFSEVLTVHIYSGDDEWADYEETLDEYVTFAGEAGKPLLVSEACRGATGDDEHVRIVREALGRLDDRDLGWIVPYLHYSSAIDCHGPEEGPYKGLGNMSFINKDGSLREGHEVFNEF